jgi:hypothetical protein
MAKNITITRGDVVVITATVRVNGTAKNLTGYTCMFYIGTIKNGTPSSEITGVVNTPASGIIVYTLTNTITKALTEENYFYEIKYFKSDKSDVKTALKGILYLDGTLKNLS